MTNQQLLNHHHFTRVSHSLSQAFFSFLQKQMLTMGLSYKPNFTLSPTHSSQLKSLPPILALKIPPSQPVFPFRSISRRPLYHEQRIWRSQTMSSAFRTRGDDVERFGVIETDSILGNGSSELRHGLRSSGVEATLNRLSKWLMVILFGAVILWRHDAESLWAAMGSVLNILLSVSLKQILNQERPIPTSKSDPGMPSSHAQSIFFTVIFSIFSMVNFLGLNEVTVITAVFAFALGSYFSWLRVAQQYHTIAQVVVGAIVGSIFSVLWFQAWDSFVLEAFISYLWVRIVVVVGSVAFCLSFLGYIIQHWLADEQEAL